MRLGRRIFDNLRRALNYITAIHVPVAGLALLPILFGMPPMLFPMQVVLLELATDPLCALAFEGEPSEAAAMSHPPPQREEAVFGLGQLLPALLQGVFILAVVFSLYRWALDHYEQDEARGAGLIASVLANLVLALCDATSVKASIFAPHRRVFWSVALAVGCILMMLFFFPPMARAFHVGAPPILLFSIAVAAGGGGFLTGSAMKIIASRASKNLTCRLRFAPRAQSTPPVELKREAPK